MRPIKPLLIFDDRLFSDSAVCEQQTRPRFDFTVVSSVDNKSARWCLCGTTRPVVFHNDDIDDLEGGESNSTSERQKKQIPCRKTRRSRRSRPSTPADWFVSLQLRPHYCNTRAVRPFFSTQKRPIGIFRDLSSISGTLELAPPHENCAVVGHRLCFSWRENGPKNGHRISLRIVEMTKEDGGYK